MTANDDITSDDDMASDEDTAADADLASRPVAKQSVIVEFFGFGDKFWTGDRRPLDPLFALEDALIATLEGKNVGEVDGHEIAVDGSDGSIFLYGANADALFAAIVSVLKGSPVMQGGHATLRYGVHDDFNVMEKYVPITPHVH